jgi:hypothetical protein
MPIKRTSFWPIMGICITVGFFSEICTPNRAVAEQQTGVSVPRVERMAVTPFVKGRYDSDIWGTLDCPISKLYFDPEKVFPDSDKILTGYVQEALEKRHGERVVALAKAVEVFKRIPKGGVKNTLRTLGQELGKSLTANLVVVGTVWRYEKRVEDFAEAGESPSSVAFAVYLIDVANGEMLWKESFDGDQYSLSENGLGAGAFFKKEAEWLSANELARYAVEEIFKKFPL